MKKSLGIAVLTAAVVLGGAVALRADPVSPKAKWEYKVVMGPGPGLEKFDAPEFEATMNKLAVDGWEYEAQFAAKSSPYVLLKRLK